MKKATAILATIGLVGITTAGTSISVGNKIVNVKSLDEQIDECIENTSRYTGVTYEELKELYDSFCGNVRYSDLCPDIYLDETVHAAKAPMSALGIDLNYTETPLANAESVTRTMRYYLPDVIYTVANDVGLYKTERELYDRGTFQPYFDSYNEDIRNRIIFYEAFLKFAGESDETVNSFMQAYEMLINSKSLNENVCEVTDSGLVMKEKFSSVLDNIGIKRKDLITRLFANDKLLAESEDVELLKSVYILPYTPNYTSMENMMTAAACLVGRVRYVWGGGHSGASYIDGINPVWTVFNSLYPTEEGQEGFDTCIKPSGSWCPIHGYSSDEYHGGSVNSMQEYVEGRADVYNASYLTNEKYSSMFSQVDYSQGINTHTLDGLDCSGFASWLYNQVTDKFNVNSTAENFVNQYGIKELNFGDSLQPGDFFAWSTHIVVIVGRVSPESKAYVTVEATPSVLRYGVVYYSGASQDDISIARSLAREANELIGGIYYEPHCYNMDSQGFYKEDDETIKVFIPDPETDAEGNLIEQEIEGIPEEYISSTAEQIEGGTLMTYVISEGATGHYVKVGRLNDTFVDPEFANLSAQGIIQRVLTHLSIQYVAGYNTYEGTFFDKYSVASEMGIGG